MGGNWSLMIAFATRWKSVNEGDLILIHSLPWEAVTPVWKSQKIEVSVQLLWSADHFCHGNLWPDPLHMLTMLCLLSKGKKDRHLALSGQLWAHSSGCCRTPCTEDFPCRWQVPVPDSTSCTSADIEQLLSSHRGAEPAKIGCPGQLSLPAPWH